MQTNYAGSSAAVLAQYIGGKCQLQLGKFAEAEQSFRSYLASAAKAPFYEQAAQTALAASLEGQGKYAEAASTYQEAGSKLSEPLASEARLDAARALRLAGSVDEARKLLQGLVADQTSEVSRQAKIDLAVLDCA